MEYTTMFEPLLIICLTLLLGILNGSMVTLIISAKELKVTNKELDKFRQLYFDEIYINSKIDEKNKKTRAKTGARTGALAR